MRISTDIKTLLKDLKAHGYRYFNTDSSVVKTIDNAVSWAGPLEEGEGYYIEQYPSRKKADIFVIRNGKVKDYVGTVRKGVRKYEERKLG